MGDCNDISDIADRLKADAAKNDHCTQDPMFCLQIKVRDIGYAPGYSSGETVWVDPENNFEEAPKPEDQADQEILHQEGLVQLGYRDRWETVMVALTRQGLEDYMELNGHNVRRRAYSGETRIYVESFFRCEEMVRLRKYLLVRAAEVVSSTRSLDRLEAVLYDRPAGRNIVEHAVETIERLRAELHALKPEHDTSAAENADLKERIDKAYEDIALDQRTNATLRADLAIAKTDLLLTQSRVERFRAQVSALKAKFEGLNDAVEEACGELPEGWMVCIFLERGAGWVDLIYPDGRMHEVHEDETKVADLVREAIRQAKEAQP